MDTTPSTPTPDERETRPAVSAMMPAFNSAGTIRPAIESLLAQTFADWELIVVDDGSTDETAAVVESIPDPRIRLHRLPENRGRGAARNAALELARGEYVAICDSDDVSVPHRFERQVAFLRDHPEVGVVSSQVLYVDGTKTQRGFEQPTTSESIKQRMRRGRSAIPNQAAMIRRALFDTHGPYEPEFRRCQDFEFFLRTMEDTEFHTLGERLVLYKQAPATLEFGYWRETSLYEHLAIRWQSARERGVVPEAMDLYRRRPTTKIRLWTIDVSRYLYFRARSAVQGARGRNDEG